MKELTIEEKAKAYDEALDICRKLYNKARADGYTSDMKDYEQIFPELKESEDERIRKGLISLITWSTSYSASGVTKEDADSLIAWLEEQGKHANFRNKIQIGDKVTRNRAGVLVNLSQLNRVAKIDEKQGESVEMNPTEFDTRLQALIGKFNSLPKEELIGSLSFWMNVVQNNGTYKSDEKQGEHDSIEEPNFFDDFRKTDSEVEPKFNVGDWVVHDMSDGRKVIRQIINMTNKSYVLDGEDFDIFYFNDLENDYHLWTIQDAKDGDVLSYVTDEEDLWIMIYRSLYEPYEGHVHYHALLVNNNFSDKGTCCISIDDLKPATKEQRDLLFQKMKESGYMWDAKKKELKKIENEIEIPFSAKDSEFLGANYCIPKGFHAEIKGNRVFIKKGEQNPAWSKEDEDIINKILCICYDFERSFEISPASTKVIKEDVDKIDSWLKSLKDRVLLYPVFVEYNEEDIDNIANTFIPEPVWNALEESEGEGSNAAAYDYSQMIAMFKAGVQWLKSLIPQNGWKPNEEQLKSLKEVINVGYFTSYPNALETLYEQLNELKG